MQIIIIIAVLIIAITLILYKVNNQFEKKEFIILLIIILLSLASCWINADEKTTNVETNNNALEIKEYTVWLKENNFINIYWNIVDNNTNTLTSNINWKIDYHLRRSFDLLF